MPVIAWLCKPQFVLFDSWYPSKKLLKRIRDYGWYFVCQLKKNRRFEGQPLQRCLQQPYWHATGCLSGGLKVLVVRYRRKYYATNRLSLYAREVHAHYKKRHEVEEVIRILKKPAEPGGLTAWPWPCAQEHHVALWLVAYLIVERERLDQGRTWHQVKRQLILNGNRSPCQHWNRSEGLRNLCQAANGCGTDSEYFWWASRTCVSGQHRRLQRITHYSFSWPNPHKPHGLG